MGYKPEEPNAYQGRQIILNSDRLLFNAKEDSILMFADKAIGFQSQGSINLTTGNGEGKNYFIVRSPGIYLGMQGINNNERPTEPAVLGDELDIYLNDICDLFENILIFLIAEYTVTTPAGPSFPGANDINFLLEEIKSLRDNIENIKSKRVKLV